MNGPETVTSSPVVFQCMCTSDEAYVIVMWMAIGPELLAAHKVSSRLGWDMEELGM